MARLVNADRGLCRSFLWSAARGGNSVFNAQANRPVGQLDGYRVGLIERR